MLASLATPIEIVRGLSWPDVEETEPTLEGNALLKARTVAALTGIDALSDDTGLEVAALGGRPGVHTARYAGPDATYEDNVALLLTELAGESNRRARFRTVVALVGVDGTEVVAEGVLDGTITEERRGDGRFGYQPVFLVDHRTLAEMTAIERAEISHRGRALRGLAALIGN